VPTFNRYVVADRTDLHLLEKPDGFLRINLAYAGLCEPLRRFETFARVTVTHHALRITL
jgi:hypothetical protein